MKYGILIVDDEPPILRALSRVLKDSQFEICVATSYEEAIEKIHEQKTSPSGCHLSLVLTDIMLVSADPAHPKNGIALMEYIHNEFPGLPVIVMSGNKDLLIFAKHNGAVETIEKPYDNEEINILANHYIKKYQKTLDK